MRAQQAGFDFDVFDMAGMSQASFADHEAAERRRRERERAERFAREQREREEQARRERAHRARRPAYESPWDVLGVQAGASKADVRAAWVRACKRHHPDAGGNVDEMKRVNRAYQEMKGMAR